MEMHLKLLLIIFSLALFVSCKSLESINTDELRSGDKAIEFKVDISMASPEGTYFIMNENGESYMEHAHYGDKATVIYRFSKKETKEIWTLVNAINPDAWEVEYELARDSRIYQIKVFQNGEIVKQTRYSAGAPTEMRDFASKLESIVTSKTNKKE